MATTVFTLPQAPQGPLNAFKTAAFTIPVGISSVTIQTNIAALDLADTSKSLEMDMECSADGGATWQFQAGFTWQGGGINRKTGLPYTTSPFITFGVGNMIGEQCRLVITIPVQITVGATVSVN